MHKAFPVPFSVSESCYVIFTVVLPMLFSAKNIFYAEPLADVISSLQSVVIFLLVLNLI